MHTSILVLADIRIVRDWLVADLSEAPDLVVTGAADCASALRASAEHRPDVLLFDRSTPDCLIAVRELLAGWPCTRAIAFGVKETEPEVAVCAEAGVRAFVPRSASRRDLVEAVRRVVQGEFVGSPAVSALLLRCHAQGPAPAQPTRLTPREIQILDLLALGRSNKEIAVALGIELATVKNHVHSLLRKLRVRRRTEAAAKWSASGRNGATRWVARRAG